jgi:glycolate oxidase FAD binding subunit
MAGTVKPRDVKELGSLIEWAAAEGEPLELIGTGTKRGLGRPMQTSLTVDLSGLAGIVAYEPEELVLTARAGTPLAKIETLLAENRQELAFEPGDLGPLYGGAAGGGTIGGVLACNLSGPRRIKSGAARDHFLGMSAVNGRGEPFKAGGRVVKNVTGYDLCKLLAGSYGTLAALTEVTLKVLPASERTRTLLLYGLEDGRAIEALTTSLGSAHDVSGTAHLPASVARRASVSYVANAGKSVTAVRVEGFPASVAARAAALTTLLASLGPIEELHSKNSGTFWAELRDATPFARAPELAIWRLAVPPASGPAIMARVKTRLAPDYWYDWAGGLIWLGVPLAGDAMRDAGAEILRSAVRSVGGHATLVRAPDPIRVAIAPFEPEGEALQRLSARVKASFDPAGILNPGRMMARDPAAAPALTTVSRVD